jgi:trehalose-6-phosphate synthase
LAGATCTTIAPLFRLWRTEMNVVRGQLINVSNRLPVQLKKYAGGMRMTPSSGGLASALDSVWKRQTGTWIGWAGKGDAEQSEQLLAGVSKKRPYTLRGVILSDDEVAKFYSGFANEIIWPLFHDFPSRCNFDPDYWEVYQQVNRKFAKVTAEVATSEGDFIWAHDYHLMLMAQQLRERGSVASNGFFSISRFQRQECLKNCLGESQFCEGYSITICSAFKATEIGIILLIVLVASFQLP